MSIEQNKKDPWPWPDDYTPKLEKLVYRLLQREKIKRNVLFAIADDEAVPATTTGVSATARIQGILLRWTANSEPDIDHYAIYRHTSNDSGAASKIAEVYATWFLDESMTASQTYYYWIKAVDHVGNITASFSSVVSTAPIRIVDDEIAPATVANVSAIALIQAVIIEWDANSELDINHYDVYRHTSDNSGASSKILEVAATLVVDGNRTASQIYYYWVKAVDHVGNESTNFSTVASATPTNVETADIVSLNANKVLIDGAVYLSNWRKSADLTKIDGGEISASSITLAKAANDLKGLAGDQVASGGASLLPNWRLDISDSNGRPAGIYPCDYTTSYDQLGWLDGDKAEIKILSTPDTTVGYGFPAIPIDDKQKYTIIIRHKSSAASATGLYLRFQQYNAALPLDKTHIGLSGGANAQTSTNQANLLINVAMPGTDWVVDTYTYTPTAGTKYASFVMMNYNPATAGVEYHVDYVLMYTIPKTADEIADGSTYGIPPKNWMHGSDVTLIDGGKIYTKSITAAVGSIDDLAVNTLQIANEAVTVPASVSGTSLEFTTTGRNLFIHASGLIHLDHRVLTQWAQWKFRIQVKRDAVVIYDSGEMERWTYLQYQEVHVPWSTGITDIPSAGTYTYTINFINIADAGDLTFETPNIFIIETKK